MKNGDSMVVVEQDRRSLILLEEESGKLDLKAQFIELRARGWSYVRISRKIKVSKSTLSNWRAELEEEIASQRAIELDALQEKYFLAKEARIKMLGELLKRISKEMAGRDLADIPTDKLLELQLKVYKELLEEYVETRPLSSQEIQLLKAL